jgi:hypothetical protein
VKRDEGDGRNSSSRWLRSGKVKLRLGVSAVRHREGLDAFYRSLEGAEGPGCEGEWWGASMASAVLALKGCAERMGWGTILRRGGQAAQSTRLPWARRSWPEASGWQLLGGAGGRRWCEWAARPIGQLSRSGVGFGRPRPREGEGRG